VAVDDIRAQLRELEADVELEVVRVADANFPTPTAFGAWLRGVLEEEQCRAREAAEAEAVARSRELLGQLGRLQKVQAALT
jgi:hypothetical protein